MAVEYGMINFIGDSGKEVCRGMQKAKKQVKSKRRVADHGDVFTADREVSAMLDLVKTETERIESRFLEPACGDGNFLVEVLRRKLDVVKKQYRRFPPDYEKFSILALSSIYGVELLQDNTDICRERLYRIWNKAYTGVCKRDATNQCREAARYILEHNILCGNALDMKRADGTPIIFAQWDLVMDSLLKRRDYRLDELLQEQQAGDAQLAIGALPSEWAFDSEVNAMMPKTIREYPPIDYRKVQENG